MRLARETARGFSIRCDASARRSGQPGLPTQLAAGQSILNHMHDLSDEVLCTRRPEDPYYQFVWRAELLP